LAALAATGVVSAQSSVTISGGIQYGASRNAAGVTSYGALKGDRNFLNFGGTEDLGGGMTATFQLQMRFRSETGRAGTYMNTDGTATTTERNLMEQANIGLNHRQFGSLRLGRFTNILSTAFPHNLMEDSGNGAGTTSQYGRLSGQAQYASPTVSGFQYVYLNAQRALNTTSTVAGNGFGTGTLNNATQSLVAHTVRYTNGPINFAVAMIDGLQGERSTHFGGTYDLGGGIKLALGQFRQQDRVATASNSQEKHNNTSAGVEYKTGPWTTALMVSQASEKIVSTDVGKKKQVGLKAYYALSKRTSIDFEASNTSNSAAASNGTAYYAGIRHNF
jgi:predicted porin